MTNELGTIEKFIEDNRLTMETDYTDENPNISDMPYGSTHYICTIKRDGGAIKIPYICTIKRDGGAIKIPYSMGPALTGPPELADVLDCLAYDACDYDNAADVLEFASEHGYDLETNADIRKARDVYRVVEGQTEALTDLLGDVYETLLYETERR